MKASLLISSAILMLLLVQGCKKAVDRSQLPAQVIAWQLDGGVEQVSDSTSFLSLFGIQIIYGKKGNTSMFVSTNSSNPGLYTCLSANAGIRFTIDTVQYTPVSCNVNISSNADRQLNGTYSSVLVSAASATISVTGRFSGIRY